MEKISKMEKKFCSQCKGIKESYDFKQDKRYIGDISDICNECYNILNPIKKSGK